MHTVWDEIFNECLLQRRSRFVIQESNCFSLGFLSMKLALKLAQDESKLGSGSLFLLHRNRAGVNI